MSVSSSLAAALAHEVRNPLLSIKGAAQLLAQAVGPEDRTLAELIVTEANRIDQLIATLDPLTPTPTQSTEALNVHEIMEHARLSVRSFAPHIHTATRYDPSLPTTRGNREALMQAMLNLVRNAAEALAEHPAPNLTFATRYLAGERMLRPDGQPLTLALSLTDNGPGVEPSLVPRLFTPFNSGKPGGKGLGLAITAKIIEEHGGLIAYESPAGGGARFSVYLPVG